MHKCIHIYTLFFSILERSVRFPGVFRMYALRCCSRGVHEPHDLQHPVRPATSDPVSARDDIVAPVITKSSD